MAEFRVVIDGLKLDEEHERRIEADLQNVLLSHLAEIDERHGGSHGRVGGGFAVVLHPGGWRGGKATHVHELETLEKMVGQPAQ